MKRAARRPAKAHQHIWARSPSITARDAENLFADNLGPAQIRRHLASGSLISGRADGVGGSA